MGDGGMGTALLGLGLDSGVAPENWLRERPQTVCRVHQAFVSAGAEWLRTNTFGANAGRRPELSAPELRDLNRRAVDLARRASSGVTVLLSVGPAGDPNRAEEFYRPQLEEPLDVDGVLVETVVSLPESLTAIRLARAVGMSPIFVSYTPGPDGHLLDGASPESAAERWVQAGAEVIGLNCGVGPESLLAPAARLVAADLAPVLAAPNAGLPHSPVDEDRFEVGAIRLLEVGVVWVGGCCGAGPNHIRAVRAAVDSRRFRLDP